MYGSSAVDTYSLENPLSIGSVGSMGCSRAGNFAVQNSDLLIVLGNRLTSMTTGESCKFARGAKVIIVDIDEIEHSKANVVYEKLILSDLKFFLRSALNHKLKKTDNEWVKKITHWKEIFPKYEDSFRSTEKIDLYHLADSLSNQLPDECVIVTDSGLIELIIPNNLDFQKNRRVVHPASQGSMGFFAEHIMLVIFQ